MSLLLLLISIIAIIFYIFAIKWICIKFNAVEYTNLFIGLGIILFLLFLAKAFGIFEMLSSVRI